MQLPTRILLALLPAYLVASAPVEDSTVNLGKRACPNIHVFGARETTVAPGYGSAITVVNDILNGFPGSTAEAIVYPACGGQASCGGDSYSQSVSAGIQAAASAVNSFNAQCPSTKLVLVGYSQVCRWVDFFFSYFKSFRMRWCECRGLGTFSIDVFLKTKFGWNPIMLTAYNLQGSEIFDAALCGGGDPNQGVTNTAVLFTAAALSQIKAAIFMGDPLYHVGLPYNVGTCQAGGVSIYFYPPSYESKHLLNRISSSTLAQQASLVQARLKSSHTATPPIPTVATAPTPLLTKVTAPSTALKLSLLFRVCLMRPELEQVRVDQEGVRLRRPQRPRQPLLAL